MPKRGHPSPFKGVPRPHLRGPRLQSRGPRPHTWKTGTDPEVHVMYVQYLQHKNQAQWRHEEYELTFENFQELWKNLWHLRGRTKGTYCLSRRDYDQPWSMDNCEVISRRDHNRRQLEHKGR